MYLVNLDVGDLVHEIFCNNLIVISYIGYKQEIITVDSNKFLKITLQEESGLETVVVNAEKKATSISLKDIGGKLKL